MNEVSKGELLWEHTYLARGMIRKRAVTILANLVVIFDICSSGKVIPKFTWHIPFNIEEINPLLLTWIAVFLDLFFILFWGMEMNTQTQRLCLKIERLLQTK